MTNDELLAKLLDNTLTEAERLELNVRMAATPHFAEEVREYLAVEEMLAKTKGSLTTAPAHLLQSVEQKTAATILTAAATTVVAETAVRSTLSGRLLIGISALVLSGAATWYLVTSGNPQPEVPVQPIAEQYNNNKQVTPVPHTPVYSPAPQQKREQVQAQRAPEEQIQQNQNNTVHSQPIVPSSPVVPTPPTDNTLPNVNAQKNERNNASKQLEEQLDAYKKYKANGNTISLMITAKKVGIVYRTLKELDNSRLYLEEALALAKTQHIDDEEAIVTGELGLLEKERGALEPAKQLLQTCVDKLRALGSPQLQRWQDELADLRKDNSNK